MMLVHNDDNRNPRPPYGWRFADRDPLQCPDLDAELFLMRRTFH